MQAIVMFGVAAEIIGDGADLLYDVFDAVVNKSPGAVGSIVFDSACLLVPDGPLNYADNVVDDVGDVAKKINRNVDNVTDATKKAGKSGRISNLDDGLNFSNKALEHMGESGRQVPIQTLQDAIRYGEAMPDPRGSNATMYYTTMYKNGKMYNLEVLYDKVSNTVYHFEYARKAMGNLPAIPK